MMNTQPDTVTHSLLPSLQCNVLTVSTLSLYQRADCCAHCHAYGSTRLVRGQEFACKSLTEDEVSARTRDKQRNAACRLWLGDVFLLSPDCYLDKQLLSPVRPPGEGFRLTALSIVHCGVVHRLKIDRLLMAANE